MKRGVGVAAVVLGLFVSVRAQDEAPLQADMRVRVDHTNRRLTLFQTALQGGGAMLRGSLQNLTGGETALVSLHFDYRTDADIALDELINQIVISTVDNRGKEFSRVTIDPNSGPLNPNRVPLSYSATVYQPPLTNRGWYIIRVRVFGNYE